MTKTIKDIIIKIPAKIRELTNSYKLNRTQLECISQIDFLNNEKGCTCTNESLAFYLGKKKRQVQRVIKSLIDLGLVIAEYENQFKRTLKTTFEKVTKKIEEVVEKAKETLRHFAPNIMSKAHDFYNYKKQSKSFNNQEIKGYQKIELKVYQYDHETKEQFEARCNESRDRLDVIVVPVPKLDKKTDNSSLIDNMNKMKNAFLSFKKINSLCK
jgi:predicted transcriptional regulator